MTFLVKNRRKAHCACPMPSGHHNCPIVWTQGILLWDKCRRKQGCGDDRTRSDSRRKGNYIHWRESGARFIPSQGGINELAIKICFQTSSISCWNSQWSQNAIESFLSITVSNYSESSSIPFGFCGYWRSGSQKPTSKIFTLLFFTYHSVAKSIILANTTLVKSEGLGNKWIRTRWSSVIG